MTSVQASKSESKQSVDSLSIGRRIRFFRKQAGMTLAELGEKVGRAASQISTIENGKLETSVTLLTAIAEALGTEVADLLDPTPVDGRQGLELEAERNQASPMYSSLGLPQVRIKSLPQGALEAIVGLQRQLAEVLTRRAATPEEARRANRELRETMREKHNYFADLEEQAAELLSLAGYESGTVSQRETATIAEKLGFSLHYVS
ncbi:XRE family transcriptional regulator, partial [Burkholderia multivorans]